jgi:hypothetical protein
MRRYLLTICTITLVFLLSGCGEPISMVPGGKLAGNIQPTPKEWRSVPEVIQVEMRASDPYSINIWGVGIGSNLYIATGEDGTTWSEFIASDSSVRARVGSALYGLRAVLVEEPEERRKVTKAYVVKYDLDSDDNWVTKGMIFRLDPKPTQ